MTPLSKALLFHIFPDRGLGERDVGRLQRNYSFIGVCVKDNKISAFKTNNMNEFGYRHATEQEIYSIFEKQIALLSSPGALQAIRSVCYSHFPISPTASPDVIRLRQSIQKKMETIFCQALDKNDFDTAKSLFYECADTVDPDGFTALHRAVLKSQEQTIEFLLMNGADRTKADSYGNYPIHYCVSKRNINCLKLLLKRNEEQLAFTNTDPWRQLNFTNSLGRVISHLAALSNDFEALEYLINLKVINLEFRDRLGNTHLHLACMDDAFRKPDPNNTGSFLPNAVVPLLIKSNADIYARNAEGHIPLHLLARFAPVELLKTVLPDIKDYMLTDKNNHTPLHHALQYGIKENADLLLEMAIRDKKVNTEAPMNMEMSLLRICTIDALNFNIEIMLKMLSRFNFSSGLWQELIWKFIEKNNITAFIALHDLTRKLEQEKQYFSALFSTKSGIFHFAAKSNSPKVLEILLKDRKNERDEQLNKRISEIETGKIPLEIALEKANPSSRTKEIIRMLLAEYNPKDDETLSSVRICAAKNNHWDVVEELLRKYGAEIEDIYYADSRGDKLLHLLARFAPVELLKRVLPVIKDYMLIDKNNHTPLHHALQYGIKENADLLLEMAIRDKKFNAEAPSNIEFSLLKICTIDALNFNIEIMLKMLSRFNFSSEQWLELIWNFIHKDNIAAFKALHDLARKLEPEKQYFSALFSTKSGTFHFAAQSNSPEILAILLKDRENESDERLNKRNTMMRSGKIPLQLALEKANPSNETKEIIRMLLAEYNPKDDDTLSSVLICAVKNNHWNVVEELLRKYEAEIKDINYADYSGNTLLHHLLNKPGQSNPYLLKILTRHDINLLAKNKAGQTPLHICLSASGPKLNLVALMDALNKTKSLPEALMAETLTPGETPLISAIGSASVKKEEEIEAFFCFTKFLCQSPDLKVYDTDNSRLDPMFVALGGANYTVIKEIFTLCKENTSTLGLINKPSPIVPYETPFHRATRLNKPQILELFIKEKISVDIPTPSGFTPLFSACKYKAHLSMKFLLENGANPNLQYASNKNTLMHLAAILNDVIGVNLLLEAGAEIDIRNITGETPLIAAIATEAVDVIKHLLSGFKDKTGKTITADSRILSNDGFSPLHFAAGREFFHPEPGNRGYTYVTEMLMELGVPLDVKDKSGKTALHYAVRKGYMANVVALMPKDPEEARKAITQLDNDNKNAFIHAFENNQLHILTFLCSKAPLAFHQMIQSYYKISDMTPYLEPLSDENGAYLINPNPDIASLLEICLLFRDNNFLKYIFKNHINFDDLASKDNVDDFILKVFEFKKEYSKKHLRWLQDELEFLRLGFEINHNPTPIKNQRVPLSDEAWIKTKQCLLQKAQEIANKKGNDNYYSVNENFIQYIQHYLTMIDNRGVSGMNSLSPGDKDAFYLDLKNHIKNLADCLEAATNFGEIDPVRLSQALIYIYDSALLCDKGYIEGASQALECYRGEPGFPLEMVTQIELNPEKTAFINSGDRYHINAVYNKAKSKALNFFGTLAMNSINQLVPLQKTKSNGTIDPGMHAHVGNQLKKIISKRTTIPWIEIGTGADNSMADIPIKPNSVINSFDKIYNTDLIFSEFKKAVFEKIPLLNSEELRTVLEVAVGMPEHIKKQEKLSLMEKGIARIDYLDEQFYADYKINDAGLRLVLLELGVFKKFDRPIFSNRGDPLIPSQFTKPMDTTSSTVVCRPLESFESKDDEKGDEHRLRKMQKTQHSRR